MTRAGLISYVQSRVAIRRLDEPTIQRVLSDFNLENLEAIPDQLGRAEIIMSQTPKYEVTK